MNRLLASIASLIVAMYAVMADNIIIKYDNHLFSEPICTGHALFADSLVFDSDAEAIHIPDTGICVPLGNYPFTRLKRVTFGNVDYLPGALFMNMPALEEVFFDGMIGHFDCSMAISCPRLRSITFSGPVASMGSGMLYNLPNIKEVRFESIAIDIETNIPQEAECPGLSEITFTGVHLHEMTDSAAVTAAADRIRGDHKLTADMYKLAQWQTEVLTSDPHDDRIGEWMRSRAYRSAKALLPVLERLDSQQADSLRAAMKYAWNLGDNVKTKLEILKEAPSYSTAPQPDITFTYAQPTDSMLTLSRHRFNLDSIAGSGDDISRIMNLLHWVHDSIRHDGSNGLAPGARTLINTYDSARRDSCGYNCRALAICLTEALLAVGIPARYITCIPKAWDTDNDCHVICVAWSKSLGKWIWVDPTFAAYVTDENGALLHPGEVRYRLQHDLPLVLNDDANWNNEYPETKEYYIDYYMAKNLYIIQANSLNQADPEGNTTHPQGYAITLVPTGVDYPYSNYNTSDDEWFWQAPQGR